MQGRSRTWLFTTADGKARSGAVRMVTNAVPSAAALAKTGSAPITLAIGPPESGAKYAGEVPSTEGSKRGPVPWLRNRISQAAGRAAERMELDPESALQSARATLDWSIRHRGPESAMTVNAKGEVAERLEHLGRYEEALQLRADIVAHLRLHLGTDDPSTLTAEGFEAFDLDRMGRHAEALPLFSHVLTGRKDALGPDDALTLLAMEWLGCSLSDCRDCFPSAITRSAVGSVAAGDSGCGQPR